MNRGYWVMRADRTQAEYSLAESRSGRMRQGWGNTASGDLESDASTVYRGHRMDSGWR